MTKEITARTIVVFTDSFPYCKESERTFMLPELKAAAEVYERVIVVPTAMRTDKAVEALLPQNVEVDTSWATSLAGRNRWVRAFRLLNPNVWTRVIGDISRSGLSFSAVGDAMSSWLHRWIDRRGLDVKDTLFYTFWFDIAALAVALESQRREGMRFVSCGHGFDLFTHRGGNLRRLMLRQVEKVVAASVTGSDYLRRHYPDYSLKIKTRRLGCVKLYPEHLARRHNNCEKCITVLSVSNVVEGKRVDQIAKLMRGLAIARVGEQVEWIHVGDGPQLEKLKSTLAEEQLPANFSYTLMGAMSNEQVHKLYTEETLDWFIMLSEREGGNPIAVCEAFAYGVPPIVTDTTGLSEMVDDDCGVVLPLDVTREEFVRGMLPYLDSDLRATAMRQAAAKRWAENYDATKLRIEFFKSL